MSTLCMKYSQIDMDTQMLIFSSLYNIIAYLNSTEDHTFFEKCIKKMYMEFAKESKIGGGGL